MGEFETSASFLGRARGPASVSQSGAAGKIGRRRRQDRSLTRRRQRVFLRPALLFEPAEQWAALLAAALIFHLFNANSFFGFTKNNAFSSAEQFAAVALIGFIAMIGVFNRIL